MLHHNPNFASGDFCCGSRLCENASEPRTLRIVFSIAYCQQHPPVRLVSATTKSRWKFYAQVRRLSFHTAWVISRQAQPRTACPLHPLKADIGLASGHVSFVPDSEVAATLAA